MEESKTMRLSRQLLVTLVLTASVTAQQESSEQSQRKAEQASAELQQKANEASGGSCAKLSMRAARQAIDDADRLFLSGSIEAAHDAVDLSVHYAQRGVECTLQSRKHQKAAEIELRGLIRRMNEVVRTLDTDERPQLTDAIAQLEKERDRLLQAIFGSGKRNEQE